MLTCITGGLGDVGGKGGARGTGTQVTRVVPHVAEGHRGRHVPVWPGSLYPFWWLSLGEPLTALDLAFLVQEMMRMIITQIIPAAQCCWVD